MTHLPRISSVLHAVTRKRCLIVYLIEFATTTVPGQRLRYFLVDPKLVAGSVPSQLPWNGTAKITILVQRSRT